MGESPLLEVSPISGNLDATTVETVYSILKRDIISGRRPPGERLRIDRMRQIYGVGPTPIRETLQRLTAEGLVIAHGGRGFQVAGLSATEFVDLNIARTEVELAALRLSIAHGDDEWESRIVAAAHRLKKADARLSEGSTEVFDKWEVANRDFHAALVSACPSRWLIHLRNNINDKCERYRRAALSQARTGRNLVREHREIMEAVLSRDVELACERMRAHCEKTVELLKLHLLDRDPATAPCTRRSESD